MNALRYATILLALTITISAFPKKKEKKTGKTETVKMDTLAIDTLSYCLGIANTKGVKNYLAARMNIDTTYMENVAEGFAKELTDEERKKVQAFAAGLEIRRQMENQSLPVLNKRITGNDSTEAINKDLFLLAFFQVIAGQPTQIPEPIADSLAESRMKAYTEINDERQKQKNIAEGEAFLKANAQNDSVHVLPSGVQYKILEEGHGEIPTDSSTVTVNYVGRLIDGTIFDSTFKRKKPSTFVVNKLILGWKEALKKMPEGSKWEVCVPQDLGYGARKMSKIPPYSTLIFTVELLKVGEEE